MSPLPSDYGSVIGVRNISLGVYDFSIANSYKVRELGLRYTRDYLPVHP